MKKLYIITQTAYALMVLHVLEELMRTKAAESDPSVLIPFTLYPVALVAIYLQKRWGIWLATILHLIGAVLTSFGHFNPSSEDYIGIIYRHWTNPFSYIAVLLAAAVTLSFITGFITGIKTLKNK